MARRPDRAIVGISDHAGWAVFVTVARDATIVDRRRVELVDADLPCMPIHHKAQTLPLPEAIELVERVRASAARHAALQLETIAKDATVPIRGVALRVCPALPPTIEEQLQDYRAQNVADWVMYRQVLATAAEARGWSVHWYDAKKVNDAACKALGIDSLAARFVEARKALGSPWNQDHKLAMAAAVAAGAAEP